MQQSPPFSVVLIEIWSPLISLKLQQMMYVVIYMIMRR